MIKLIHILLCHNCGTSFEKDLAYRTCSNCFACTGCETYTCPECAIEIVVIPKKVPHDPQAPNPNHPA